MGTLQYLIRYMYLLPVLFASTSNANSLKNYRENYLTYKLESDTVCTLGYKIGSRTIDLDKGDKSAVIVEETQYFDELSGAWPFDCQFKVRAVEKDTGLFVVIQMMRLRKNMTTGECTDYVQFRRTYTYPWGPVNVELKGNTAPPPWSDKYCGSINAKDVNFDTHHPADQSRVLPNAYIEDEGKVDVRVHIASGSPVRPKELELKMVFTTFTKCNQHSNGTYVKCGNDSCIFHGYVNDGILNCPFVTCKDEDGCRILYEAGLRPTTKLATKVMVGAVAGVFTMFVVFVVFLWLFRHCSLCWSEAGVNLPNSTQMRPVPTMEDVQPTAPSRTPSIDKDLPPSYESLFPNS